ncbi:hypothetical protein ABPG75_007813 [Micractinium tetrahymenae]
MVRERQLNWQIHTAAAHAGALWRPLPAAPAPAALLRRRGATPLSVHVPVTATGVDTADAVVYVRSIETRCSSACSPSAAAAPPAADLLAAAPPSAAIFAPTPLYPAALPPPPPLSMPAAWAQRAGATAPAPAASEAAAKPTPLLRLATPPTLHEWARPAAPPHKRSRLDMPQAAGPHPGHSPMPASAAASLPALARSGKAVLPVQPLADAWCMHPQQPSRRRPQQQTRADDPHGVLSWLRKIKSMLEHPAGPAPVYC